jgi:hypothetical protein
MKETLETHLSVARTELHTNALPATDSTQTEIVRDNDDARPTRKRKAPDYLRHVMMELD